MHIIRRINCINATPGCPKHVENRNKHKKKLCAKLVYLQRLYEDARSTVHKTEYIEQKSNIRKSK